MKIKKSDIAAIFLLTALSLAALLPMKVPKLWKSHDILFHSYRLASFSASIDEGNIVPRWGGNLNRSYGTPVLMFNYPLNYYLGYVFLSLGFSMVDSIKLLFAAFYLAGGVGMFLLLKRFTGTAGALAGALVFLFIPYRFVLIYVRAALGEHGGLSLSPWVFLAFDRFLEKASRRRLALAAVAFASLILLHQVIALMVSGLLVIFIFLKIVLCRAGFRRLFYVAAALALGTALTSFFLIPALTESRYTLLNLIGLQQTYISRYPQFRELFYSPWGFGLGPENGQLAGFSVSLGWISWLVLIVGGTMMLLDKKARTVLGLAGLIGVMAAIFFMTTFSAAISQTVLWIRYFQFPWRFLSLAGLSIPFLAPVIADRSSKFILWLGVTVLVFTSIPMWRVQGYYDFPKDNHDFYRPIETSGDTGEATPRWTTRFQDYWPKDVLETVWGEKIDFEVKKRKIELHEYSITASVPTQVVDNTLYFPGWKVYVDEKETPIEYQDQNWRGLITFPVSAGRHAVKIIFEETRLRKFADALSMISLGILLALFIKKENYGYNS